MFDKRNRPQARKVRAETPTCNAPQCAPGWWTALRGATVVVVVAAAATAWGQAGAAGQADAAGKGTAEKTRTKPVPLQPAEDWLRLTRDYDVWLDTKKKQVIVGGEVCLREGMLEMFACPKGTKEHESIVSVNSPARYVHAGLVALGAKPGPPVQFEPTYKPAEGTVVDVQVVWKDQRGDVHRAKAQDWVKHIKTGKALEYPWVFAGSGFWTDEAAGERFYYADGGEFICVSNFSTAMLDLPVKSSDANDTLMFAAFTQRIPPRGTPVQLILTPQLTKAAANATAGEKTSTEETKAKAKVPASDKETETPAKTGEKDGGKPVESSGKKDS